MKRSPHAGGWGERGARGRASSLPHGRQFGRRRWISTATSGGVTSSVRPLLSSLAGGLLYFPLLSGFFPLAGWLLELNREQRGVGEKTNDATPHEQIGDDARW